MDKSMGIEIVSKKTGEPIKEWKHEHKPILLKFFWGQHLMPVVDMGDMYKSLEDEYFIRINKMNNELIDDLKNFKERFEGSSWGAMTYDNPLITELLEYLEGLDI